MRVECTGIAASWCPVHGDCSCPRSGDGEILWFFEAGYVSYAGWPTWSETASRRTFYSYLCPIHGLMTDHPA